MGKVASSGEHIIHLSTFIIFRLNFAVYIDPVWTSQCSCHSSTVTAPVSHPGLFCGPRGMGCGPAPPAPPPPPATTTAAPTTTEPTTPTPSTAAGGGGTGGTTGGTTGGGAV